MNSAPGFRTPSTRHAHARRAGRRSRCSAAAGIRRYGSGDARPFQQHDVAAAFGEQRRGGTPGGAAADDQDVAFPLPACAHLSCVGCRRGATRARPPGPACGSADPSGRGNVPGGAIALQAGSLVWCVCRAPALYLDRDQASHDDLRSGYGAVIDPRNRPGWEKRDADRAAPQRGRCRMAPCRRSRRQDPADRGHYTWEPVAGMPEGQPDESTQGRSPMMTGLSQRLMAGWVGAAIFILLLLLWSLPPDIPRGFLRERALDALLPLLPRPAGAKPEIVIVDIDRDTIAALGPWPWPRTRLARLVNAAAMARPTALGIDILIEGSDRFSAAALLDALSPEGRSADVAVWRPASPMVTQRSPLPWLSRQPPWASAWTTAGWDRPCRSRRSCWPRR